jgi:hypothetical protein
MTMKNNMMSLIAEEKCRDSRNPNRSPVEIVDYQSDYA